MHIKDCEYISQIREKQQRRNDLFEDISHQKHTMHTYIYEGEKR